MIIARVAAILLILVGLLPAQVPSGKTLAVFTAYRESVGTTEKVTIQQPASGSRKVRLVSAWVYCSAGCDITQSRDGTAATATALTVSPVNPTVASTSKANAFHTSNVGAGTAVGAKVTLGSATGYQTTLNLDGIYMLDDGAAQNYTISLAATSGTNRILIKWEEF